MGKNDRHNNDSDSISSRQSSSGVSVPLLAMLNMYGYQDDDNDDDHDDENVDHSPQVLLMKSDIDIINAPININMNNNNNYPANIIRNNNNSNNNSIVAIDSNHNIKGKSTSITDMIDIFAGDDFVKARDQDHHEGAYSELSAAPDKGLVVDDPFDGLSSLPPLKSRFQYDDDDSLPLFDMKSFSNHTVRSHKGRDLSFKSNQSNSTMISTIVSPSIEKTTSHQSTTMINDKHNKDDDVNRGAGAEREGKSNIVSFSLKKKQRL